MVSSVGFTGKKKKYIITGSKVIHTLIEFPTQTNGQKNYYWKYLKNKLKSENNEVVSITNQLKLTAPDGKKRLTDVLDNSGVLSLAACFPNTKAARFVEWFTNSDETIDGRSKSKAYALFESSLIDSIEVGTIKGLQLTGRLKSQSPRNHKYKPAPLPRLRLHPDIPSMQSNYLPA